MDRIYGDHTCHLCGRVPELGFVYVCRQDAQVPAFRASKHVEYDVDQPDELDETNLHQTVAEIAIDLGMNDSIVKQILDKVYTVDEMAKLISQRERVVRLLKSAERHHQRKNASRQINPSQTGATSSPATAHAGYVAADRDQDTHSSGSNETPSVNKEAKKAPAGKSPKSASRPSPLPKSKNIRAITVMSSPCNFQVCHRCRPGYRGRIYANLDSVLKEPQPALTEEDIKTLPVLDASILKNISLRRPAPIAPPPGLDSGDMLADLGFTSSASGHFGEGPTQVSRDSSNLGRESPEGPDRFPCPGPGVCPLFTEQRGCAYDSGFDDGQRAFSHGFLRDEVDPLAVLSRQSEHGTPSSTPYRSRHLEDAVYDTPGGTSITASSISQPTPTTVPLSSVAQEEEDKLEDQLASLLGKPRQKAPVSERTNTSGLAGGMPTSGLDRQLRHKRDSSSTGGEVFVRGGVALTEEAVETGSPDIITAEE